MLLYGNVNSIPYGADMVLFNLTSLKEGMVRLPYLVPPNTLGRFTGKEFDIMYANYIMSNDVVFTEFFHIIYNLYIGKDVYLVVSEDDWSENLIESIAKFIQQRYGYNAIEIKTDLDYIQACNSDVIPQFEKTFGLANLDIDKERYTQIIELDRIRRTGKVLEYEE